MARLGSFGTPRPAVEDSFEWFGVDIRVHPDLTDLAFVELFQSIGDGHDGKQAMDAIQGIARSVVHPDDFEEFWRLARSNRQTLEDVMTLATSLIAELADRPTKLPSDSSDGQQRTGTSSTGDSSSRALHALEGRPDLQVAVVRRAKAG